jgi:hypothetical protein
MPAEKSVRTADQPGGTRSALAAQRWPGPQPTSNTFFYRLPPSDGDLLKVFRLVFGSVMVLSIVLGFLPYGGATLPSIAPG